MIFFSMQRSLNEIKIATNKIKQLSYCLMFRKKVARKYTFSVAHWLQHQDRVYA